jgi:hypothetical protein
MRTQAAIVGMATLAAAIVLGACGGGSGHAAGSGHTAGATATVSTRRGPVGPTTTQTPQAARANARCLLGGDAVSAILGAPYGAPRIVPSGAGKVCRYEAGNGGGSVVVILRLGVTAADFAADRGAFDLAGTPTKDWSGIGDLGFTGANPGEHSVTAGALEGDAEVIASATGAGTLANAEDLVKTAVTVLVTGS